MALSGLKAFRRGVNGVNPRIPKVLTKWQNAFRRPSILDFQTLQARTTFEKRFLLLLEGLSKNEP